MLNAETGLSTDLNYIYDIQLKQITRNKGKAEMFAFHLEF